MVDLTEHFHIELEFRCEGLDAGFHVADFTLTEALSETYRASIELHVADPSLAPRMLGKNAVLIIRRGGGERRVHGILTRTEHGGVLTVESENTALLRVQLEPAVCALKHTRDSRIFQGADVVAILREVLGPLSGYRRQFDLDKLKPSYPAREYTVQYDESDFDFLARLAAEEGITFFFDHTGRFEDRVYEKLVFADESSDFVEFKSIDGSTKVEMSETAGDDPDTERIFAFYRADELGSTSSAVRDYDWTRPDSAPSKVETLGVLDAQGRERVVYASIGETTIGGYDGGQTAYTQIDIAARATRMQERLHNHDLTFAGESLVTGFMPGHKLKLDRHPLGGFNDREYVLTSITHYGGASAARGDVTDRYRNHFTAVRVTAGEGDPAPVPYRPPLTTPWPRIHGVQTARVVGPEVAGAELHTDEHGRVRVQFHWDRHGTRTDHSSCFIRVAQAWAGAGYGFLFIPRIGHEVIVSFIEGNPDRPLVTGSVYNGSNTPFYELTANETRSVIRTKTFGDGATGYNEISFDDKPGKEELFLHASHNMKEVVENDHNTTVHGSQTNTVDGGQTEGIGGAQAMTVGASRTKDITLDETTTVGGNRTETVTGDETIIITGARTETVTGDETITIAANRTESVAVAESVTIGASRSHTVGIKDSLSVGAARSVNVGGALSINVGALRTLTVAGAQVTEIGAAHSVSVSGTQKNEVGGDRKSTVGKNDSVTAGKKLVMEAGDEITLKTGDASIVMKKNGDITIKGKNITLQGSGKINIKASSDVVIKGSKVGAN